MRRWSSRFVAAALGTVALHAGLLAAASPSSNHAAGYQIIRNPHNPVEIVDRQFLEDAFLKKKTSWPTGSPIRPVDLPPTAPARREFSDHMLRRPVEAIRSFWQQRIFAGRDLPPPELKSDEEVVKFVMREPGAIGYVSNNAVLNGTKPLAVK
jgi:ABC-type phosphate transport system substrate-binding protein